MCKERRGFDITVVNFDGAETYEITGIYLLHDLKKNR